MMLNVRYRSGVVGEADRVVHAATGMNDGTLVALCGTVMDPSEVEESRGMPCMRCVQVTIQLAARSELAEERPRRRVLECSRKPNRPPHR